MNLLELYADEIKELCRKHKVKKLSAFGSLVKGNFNETSDIDLIVDFEPMAPGEYGSNYFAFKFALEDYFNRPVDLIEEQEMTNPYFKKNVDTYRQTVYAK